ncbi:alpha/beta hydrolase family protein [Porphyromonas pogonae]|uniref:alpha/beta hydrolase family protein n=1 Tax=Porphyromonas pogonae TaxID=867595 RepID=UPI002E779560|nr:prolyl oligopeptidase family serine peptidase [Porphyromonas pogonae]
MKHSTLKLILAITMVAIISVRANGQILTKALQYGPYTTSAPLIVDSVNSQNKVFSIDELLKTPYTPDEHKGKMVTTGAKGFFKVDRPQKNSSSCLSIFTFAPTINTYTTGDMLIYGHGRYAIYDGNTLLAASEDVNKNADSVPALKTKITFEASTRHLIIRSLSLPHDSVSSDFKVEFKPDKKFPKLDSLASNNRREYFSLPFMMTGKSLTSVSLSPSGKYALVHYVIKEVDASTTYTELRDRTGKILKTDKDLNQCYWMPKSDLLLEQSPKGSVTQLLQVNPATGRKTVWVESLPGKNFQVSPDEKTLYAYEEEKGPQKDDKVIRRLDPNDRQPNWRERSRIYRYHIESGIYEPITFGYQSVSLMDMNDDGSKLLIGIYSTDWTKSPYNQTTVMLYTPQTGKTDTIIKRAFEVDHAEFIPHTNDILISASANAFDGIGKQLPKDKLANSYDKQLFRMDITTRKVIPLTKDFDPAVVSTSMDLKNNALLFTAENGGRKSLYKLDLKNNKITDLKVKEDVVRSYSVAPYGGNIWYMGQSANNSDRLYILEGVNKSKLLYDLSAEKLAHVTFTPAQDWVYQAPDGSKIDGWYYLPPNFDPQKKYPMLVYYYGGTSPIQRTLEGTYSLAMYAAQGYVVYTLNPSGSTGYGQQFAARHINAWGDYTANDIIGAVKDFAQKHDFVNAKKSGCFGASYGGFMTQYLQTQTDIFACAISHAGITSISNYWGSGYWGMGYSTVASAGSFPWNNPDLYVKHSPLFNADKIHTPLLLLHGSADTNVPTAESTNMYNALKILGREVEFIEFTGQDHFILEPSRKIAWTHTMFAWFAKWLKDDPSWWDTMYPKQNL